MDWGDFLNQTAQQYVGGLASGGGKTSPAAAPVSQAPNGALYTEGKPAGGMASGMGGMFGSINPMYLAIGGVAVAVLGFVVLRK